MGNTPVPVKNPLKSGTIWSLVATLAIAVATFFGIDLNPFDIPGLLGVEVTPEQQTAMNNMVTMLLPIVLAAWRRVKAKGPLGKQPKENAGTPAATAEGAGT
jgi:hypothetical protein